MFTMNSKPQVNTLLKYRFVKRETKSPELDTQNHENGSDGNTSTIEELNKHSEDSKSSADLEGIVKTQTNMKIWLT